MKILNLRALYRFDGYVVEKIVVEEVGVQVKMRCVSSWAAACPTRAVAARFAISESTVRRYDQEVLQHDLPEPHLDGIEVLLVDEKAVRKGHGYVTVVINALTGELLHMDDGKKKDSLLSFFAKLNAEQKASIRVVGIDRNGAYRAVINE